MKDGMKDRPKRPCKIRKGGMALTLAQFSAYDLPQYKHVLQTCIACRCFHAVAYHISSVTAGLKGDRCIMRSECPNRRSKIFKDKNAEDRVRYVRGGDQCNLARIA